MQQIQIQYKDGEILCMWRNVILQGVITLLINAKIYNRFRIK